MKVTFLLAGMCAVLPQMIVSKIRHGEIVRAFASTNVQLGGGGACLAAVSVKGVQQSGFVERNIRLTLGARARPATNRLTASACQSSPPSAGAVW